ncbi:GNAT family N-acetyltransferase [Anaeroselena agilis]|uniref:GNAT family N-acetyltransferase n=1 Tax=Anaeroselena agilis TaxID=3063788 RepID=A0ABU3NS37_9FIRM|nr:GNAT family N-acetyltransferase [Selenomonadales bacterium 4137-cl]
MAIEAELIVPSRQDYIAPVIAYVSELARLMGFADKERGEIELAAEEVFCNIVEHGFESGQQEHFRIIFRNDADKLTVIFREKGIPFDPKGITPYSPDETKANLKAKGLGTYLIRKMVDEVVFCNLGREGKEISLVKYLPKNGDSASREDAAQADGAAASGQARRGDVQFTVRRIEKADAVQVAKCAYRTYGYSYAEHVYYPELIIEYNRNGRLFSAVAVSDDGEIIGYGDLEFPYMGAAIAEVESVFVSPAYRHTRAFFKLVKFLVEHSRSFGLQGLFCLSVTNHTITQRGAKMMGGTDCALLLGFMPESTDFKQIAGKAGQRISVLASYIPLKSRETVNIYPPARHREMIERIFQAAGIPSVAGGSFERPSSQATELDCEVLRDMNVASIKVTQAGGDAAERIRQEVRGYCRERFDIIYLYLDLQHPATALLAEQAEHMGFIFAGALPYGLRGRDALILQYLNNVMIDATQIQLASPLANSIMEYIAGFLES